MMGTETESFRVEGRYQEPCALILRDLIKHLYLVAVFQILLLFSSFSMRDIFTVPGPMTDLSLAANLNVRKEIIDSILIILTSLTDGSQSILYLCLHCSILHSTILLELWQADLNLGFGCEGIRVGLVQVTKCMVDITMVCLIGSNIKQQRPHATIILRHLPILDCHLWCFEFLPQRKMSVVEIFDCLRVSYNGLFLEISHKSVADLW